MTGLARPCVEQRPQTVGRLRGSRRRHPILAEQAVADLEFLPAFEAHVGRRLRKDIGVDEFVGRGSTGLHGLEGFHLREIARGRGNRGNGLLVFGRQVGTPGGHIRGGGGAGVSRRRQYGG
ncbi:hypothetical protein G6F50_013999 [Rhizopus delemar]|uniref:Uncharacterized protein n=1 Tax=Rhizopus delemar TaxID=936053 RepID=A0A9P6YA80_9FUNG|nr:hypothetical protein G6F50_013999 [Rhizopus delemar]